MSCLSVCCFELLLIYYSIDLTLHRAVSFISQLDRNPLKERGCISYFLLDVDPVGTGILVMSLHSDQVSSIWNRL